LDTKTGRLDKSPRNPHTGQRLSVTDPNGWVTFQEAVNAKYPAVGMLLTKNDPYVVIDLDASSNTDDNNFAKKVYEAFDTYAEKSVSGNGVHLILRGDTDVGRRQRNVEVYSQERYIICTGDQLKGNTINEAPDTLRKLRAKLQESDNPDTLPPLQNMDEVESDSQILLKMFGAANGEAVKTLYSTRPSSTDDWSKLDAQLAQHIAFYTKNHDQAIRLFRKSALYRGDGSTEKKSGYEKTVKYEEDYLLRRTFARAWFLEEQRKKVRDERAKVQEGIIAASLERRKLLAESSEAITIKTTLETHEAEGKDTCISPITGEIIPIVSQVKSKQYLTMFPMTKPPGLVGEIAEYFYNLSDRPFWEAAIAGAISFVSGVAGRHYNINGSGLGLYTVLLGQTGTGKNIASTGVDKLFSQIGATVPQVYSFRGASGIASGQALLRSLGEVDKQVCIPSKLLVLGEFGHMLKIITARDAGQADVKTRQVLLDLYSRNSWGSIVGETVYSDSERNAKTVVSPNLALLGDTTPVNFYESVNLGLIGEGFIPRFFIIEYEGMRPRNNKSIVSLASEELLTKCSTLVQTVLSMYNQNQHLVINYEETAKSILDNFNDFCDTQINIPQNDSIDQARAQIWNRAHLNALRLAGVLAVGSNPFNPVISEADANWAVNMITRSVYSIQRRIDSGAFGKGTAAKQELMLDCIRNYYHSDYVDQQLQKSKSKEESSFWSLVKSKSLLPYAYIHSKLQSEPLFENSTRDKCYASNIGKFRLRQAA
jgi:hypothetical protein